MRTLFCTSTLWLFWFVSARSTRSPITLRTIATRATGSWSTISATSTAAAWATRFIVTLIVTTATTRVMIHWFKFFHQLIVL
ncbi:hypothetical protein D3C72_1892810 [compost metagenome]